MCLLRRATLVQNDNFTVFVKSKPFVVFFCVISLLSYSGSLGTPCCPLCSTGRGFTDDEVTGTLELTLRKKGRRWPEGWEWSVRDSLPSLIQREQKPDWLRGGGHGVWHRCQAPWHTAVTRTGRQVFGQAAAWGEGRNGRVVSSYEGFEKTYRRVHFWQALSTIMREALILRMVVNTDFGVCLPHLKGRSLDV